MIAMLVLGVLPVQAMLADPVILRPHSGNGQRTCHARPAVNDDDSADLIQSDFDNTDVTLFQVSMSSNVTSSKRSCGVYNSGCYCTSGSQNYYMNSVTHDPVGLTAKLSACTAACEAKGVAGCCGFTAYWNSYSNGQYGCSFAVGGVQSCNGNTYYRASVCTTPPPTPPPTTAPTLTPTPPPMSPTAHLPSTAVGDPHVTNLIGATFDVNQPGEHVLLRAPFDEGLPPQLEVRAKMASMPASPCGMWITEVILGGDWVGGSEIRVHTWTQGSAEDKQDHFALLSGSGDASAASRWRPWAEFGRDAEVALSGNVTVRPAFRAFQGAVAVKDRRIFEFLIGTAPALDKRLSIVVAQAPRHAALDVQAARLGRLGVARFGGLLGTEEPDPAVGELSPECAAHLTKRAAVRQPGSERVVAESAGSSAQARLYSDPDRDETATRMTASW